MANDYKIEAKRDAARMALEVLGDIVLQLKKNGSASLDLSDYDGGEHYRSRFDQGYGLHEAADIIDQLSDYEADDEGLWQGLAPREAISVMAAETYTNAVYDLWKDLIDRINTAVADNLDQFTIGPKEWSPHKKESKLTAFVKDHIKAELED